MTADSDAPLGAPKESRGGCSPRIKHDLGRIPCKTASKGVLGESKSGEAIVPEGCAERGKGVPAHAEATKTQCEIV